MPAERQFLATFVSKRKFLIKESEKAICVADDPGVKSCWQGTWLSKTSLQGGVFTLIDPDAGEIEFMVKKSTAKKKGL